MGSNDYYPPNNYYGQATQPNGQQSFGSYDPQATTSSYNQNYSSGYQTQTQHQNQAQNQNHNRNTTYTTAHPAQQAQNTPGWNGGSYEGAQDGRAAEALRNLSNTAYNNNNNNNNNNSNNGGAVTSPGIQAASTSTHRYNSTVQQQGNINRTATSPTAYANRTSRPASTSLQAQTGARYGLPIPASVAFPSQTTYTNATPHNRSGSPAQYARTASHAHDTNNVARTDYSNTSNQAESHSNLSYQQPNANTTSSTYGQTSMHTVDPIQVYDPWPEIQRKQEAARVAKAAEDAVRAEATRRAEEENVQKAEVERVRTAEEERMRAERDSAVRAEEVRKQAEELESKREEDEKKAKKEDQKRKRAEAKKRKDEARAAASSNSPAVQSVEPFENSKEGKIRELMAQLRAVNAEEPELLAKLWEEERKSNATSRSPNVQNKSTPGPDSTTQNAVNSPHPTAAKANVQGVLRAPNGQSMSPAVQPPRPAATVPRAQSTKQTPKPSAGAVWPPEKREALAAAAATWLNDQPANHDKLIGAKEICDKLDKNPTYIELCEWFESRGLKLDRAAFARHLLEAVPDVNSASRQQTQMRQRDVAARSPPIAAAHVNGTSRPIAIIPGGSKTTPMTVQPSLSVAYESPSYSYGQPSYPGFGGQANARASSDYPEVSNDGTNMPYFTTNLPSLPPTTDDGPGERPPFDNMESALAETKSTLAQPRSKEEAARKRNFSDLIDLTAVSDDDEPPPPKRINTGAAPFTLYVPPHMPVPPRYSTSAPEPVSVKQSFQPNMGQSRPNGVPAQPPKDDLSLLDVVKPLDRKKALRRSTYNSKTIARDVLLATGRHPDMRALNAHLDILRTTFRHVDNFSDLSTFRWSLVDPGEPPKEMLTNALDGDLADDEDDDEDEEERRRRQRARSRPAPQQGITAGGDSVTSLTMSSSTPTSQKMPKRRGRPPMYGRPGTTRPYGFGDGEPPHQSTPAASAREHRPGDGNRSASASQLSLTQTQSAPASGAAHAITPGSGIGYSAFRQYAEDRTPLPKKRGRPVGWRKAVHGSAAAQANTVTRSPATLSSLRKVTTQDKPSAQKRSPERAFIIFKCGWKDCAAELHNLDTLRRHVFSVHSKVAASGGLDCLWSGCGRDVKVRDDATGSESSKRKPLWFSTEAQWKSHIELQHLQSIAWKQGDGPASGLSDAHDSEMSEAYMADSRGRRVTPRITAPSRPSLSPVHRPDQPRGRGRPRKKPVEEEAREAQRDLENRKRSFGPGIDRGGSRLATEKRRMGFIDDEDIEEIVNVDD